MSNEPQHPTTDDPGVWHAYWTAQGTASRTEPEIDSDWQAYLA